MDCEERDRERQVKQAYVQSEGKEKNVNDTCKANLTLPMTQDYPESIIPSQFVKEEPRRTRSDNKKGKAGAHRKCCECEQMTENRPKRPHKRRNINNYKKKGGKKKIAVTLDVALKRERNRLAQRKRRAKMDSEKREREKQVKQAYLQSRREQKKFNDTCKTNSTLWNMQDQEKYAAFNLQESGRRTLYYEEKANTSETTKLGVMGPQNCQRNTTVSVSALNGQNVNALDKRSEIEVVAKRRESNRLAQRRRANMDPEKKKFKKENNVAYARSQSSQQFEIYIDVASDTDNNLSSLTTSVWSLATNCFLSSEERRVSDQPHEIQQEAPIIIKEEPQPTLDKARQKRKMHYHRYRERCKQDVIKYASFKLLDRERQREYRRTLPETKKVRAREKARIRQIAYRARKKAKGETPKIKAMNPADITTRREKNRLAQQKRRANMDPEKKKLERKRAALYARSKKKKNFEIYVDTDISLSSSTANATSEEKNSFMHIGNKLEFDQPQGIHQQQLPFIAKEPQPNLNKAEKRKITNRRYREKLKLDENKYATFKQLAREKKRQYRRTLSETQKAKAREKARLRVIACRARKKASQENCPKTNCPKAQPLNPAILEIRREKNRLAQQRRRANMDPQKKKLEKQRAVLYARRRKMLEVYNNAASNSSYPTRDATEFKTQSSKAVGDKGASDQPQGIHKQKLPFIKEEPQAAHESEKKRIMNRRYREKLKLNINKYASFKLMNRERSRQYRRNLSESQKAKAREKTRLRAITYRTHKKESQEKCPKVQPNNSALIAKRCEKNRLALQKRTANTDPEGKKMEKQCALMYARSTAQQTLEINTSTATYSSYPTIEAKSSLPVRDKETSDQCLGREQQEFPLIKEEFQPVLNKEEERKGYNRHNRTRLLLPVPDLKKAEKIKIHNRRYRERLRLDEEKYASFKLQERERSRQYRRNLSEPNKSKAREKARLRAIVYRAHKKAVHEKSPKACSKPQKSMREKCLKERPKDPAKVALRREQNRMAQQRRRANMDAEKRKEEKKRNLAYYYQKSKRDRKNTGNARKTSKRNASGSKSKTQTLRRRNHPLMRDPVALDHSYAKKTLES